MWPLWQQEFPIWLKNKPIIISRRVYLKKGALTWQKAQYRKYYNAGIDAGEYVNWHNYQRINFSIVTKIIKAGHVHKSTPTGSETKEHLDCRISPDLEVEQAMPFWIEEKFDAFQCAR